VVVELIPPLLLEGLEEIGNFLNTFEERLDSAVDVAFLGCGVGAENVLGSLRLIVVEEIPLLFVGA